MPLCLINDWNCLVKPRAFVTGSKHLLHFFVEHFFISLTKKFNNSQYEQLPVGLIAQLVEHCIGIARGHGFESRSSLKFFQAFFSQLLKLPTNCDDLCSMSSVEREIPLGALLLSSIRNI